MKGLVRQNQTNYLRSTPENYSKVTENEIIGWDALSKYLGRNINYAKTVLKPDPTFPHGEKRRIRHYNILFWNKADVDAWIERTGWKR